MIILKLFLQKFITSGSCKEVSFGIGNIEFLASVTKDLIGYILKTLFCTNEKCYIEMNVGHVMSTWKSILFAAHTKYK
jgi:hypothetical protein